jgi:uncharacterized membrane protein YfcA
LDGINADYWFLGPIAVVISTIAMASGVEGATFFTPVFIIILGLPTDVAVGTGLITEVFGFSSGLLAYVRRGLIDYRLGRTLLWVTIPAALGGTVLAQIIPGSVLKGVLGLGLVAIALSFLRPSSVPLAVIGIGSAEPRDDQRQLTARTGEVFCYTPPNLTAGRGFSILGALFLGMVSTGLGQLNGYFLIQRSRMPAQVAIATSVFMVAITALVASVGHGIQFARSGGETLATVLSLVIFTVPGVLLGAQIGSWLASRLPHHWLERAMGILFLAVGAILLGELITAL